MEEKPPTKAKPSAERDDTPEELRARLRQLACDYFAAFYRDPTEENLQLAQLLSAISYSPDRRRKLANEERQLASREAGTNKTFWRKAWVHLIPPLVADCGGNPDTVARELVSLLPASLRAKCPDYPANEADFEKTVTRVLAAKNFQRQVAEWETGEQDVLKLARAVLRGCGMKKDKAKSLLR